MKALRFGLVIMAAAMITFGLGGTALAFHGGGVAHCDGCHSMHQQVDGVAIGGTPNGNLTKGSDASSTCLNCHAGDDSYHVLSGDGTNFTPGGDFYWITSTAGTWTVPHSDDSTPERRGHNIVASDFGLAADARFSGNAPGAGAGIPYANANLGCTSCHDAHGQVLAGSSGSAIVGSGSYGDPDPATGILGNYRLLGDSAYTAGDSDLDGYAFSENAPIARAAAFPFGTPYAETNTSHTDYGSGMSNWCANCHEGFLNPGNMHPVDVTLGSLGVNYNRYRATGDYDPARTATGAYDFLVPFERNTTDRTALDPTNGDGTDTNSRVMCLTCHRAHSSPFVHNARWDMGVEFLAESNSGNAAIQTIQYGTRDVVAYYGEFQRSLCNKCHHQD